MSKLLARIRKALFPSVKWKSPLVAVTLRILDPIDYLFRWVRGRHQQPRLSIRERSNGIRGQFGGYRFKAMGDSFVGTAIDHNWLQNHSRILEIGCGCGRNVYALSRRFDDFEYEGVDIDKRSIESAANNPYLKSLKCRFRLIDVHNDQYNPSGLTPAKEYRFPFSPGSFDSIILVSVFTHMMPDDIKNYMSEIGRLLRPGGRVVFTTFLMDYDCTFNGKVFEFGEGPYRSTRSDLPEICMGYFLSFFDTAIAAAGLERTDSPLLSKLRQADGIAARGEFSQDIVTARKSAE